MNENSDQDAKKFLILLQERVAELLTLSMAPKRVIAQSGVLASESSGDQIDFCYLNTVFELYSSYHFGQVVEAA